jgi:D-glucuronyl C5-epimerase C-terminus
VRAIGVALVAVLTAAAASPSAAAGDLSAAGVIYRSAGDTRYFHPLASFGSLNREVTAGRRKRATKLAHRLVSRAERRRFALVWQYRVPRTGRGPWASGLAQAVAAQALARAGRHEEARRAFLAIPNGLLINLRQGPWIKLYGYSDVVVLNAQLQAALSIAEYGRLTDDARARRLAHAMRRAARTLLPRFDTGSWSLYALGGRPATLEYHSYVASLLWKLAARQGGGVWQRYAARFRRDLRVPPELRGGRPPAPAAPVPDGFRDSTAIGFWLSKPATVTFRIAGDVAAQSFGRGWQTFTWWPELTRAGRYPVSASAVDAAGNRTVARLSDVTVERDTTRPAVRASLSADRLEWRASDSGSPWFDVRLERLARARVQVVELGRFGRRGSAALAARPTRAGAVALLVADSSGNVARVPLCVAE